MVGVPCGAHLRVLRSHVEGVSLEVLLDQLRRARAVCASLGLSPSRFKKVPGMHDAWTEFSVVADTEVDALALAEILGLVDVWGVPLRPTTALRR